MWSVTLVRPEVSAKTPLSFGSIVVICLNSSSRDPYFYLSIFPLPVVPYTDNYGQSSVSGCPFLRSFLQRNCVGFSTL